MNILHKIFAIKVHTRRPPSNLSGMSKTYVGSRLRQLRRERDLSQASLAATLGLSASYVNQIEQRAEKPGSKFAFTPKPGDLAFLESKSTPCPAGLK